MLRPGHSAVPGVESPLSDWGAPIVSWEAASPDGWPVGWLRTLAPYWTALCGLLDGAIRDPLVARHWHAVVERFDATSPQSADDANRVWKEAVVSVWKLLNAHAARVAQARRAIRR